MTTIRRDEATQPVKLTIEEIKMLMQLGIQVREAMAIAQATQQMEAQYVEILRGKYGLGQEWGIPNYLVGFERFVAVEETNGPGGPVTNG